MSQRQQQSELYTSEEVIAYLAGFPGARQADDLVAVRIEGDDRVEVDAELSSEVDVSDDKERLLGQVTVTNLTDVNLEGQASPLDVSASTVPIQSDGPLDVSGTTVPIQEDTALDVSGTTVPIQEDTALDVSASTVPVEHQGVIDVSSRDSRNLGDVDVTDLPDADRADWASATLPADGSIEHSVAAVGADRLRGRVSSSGTYDLEVAWLAEDGTELFTDSVASGVAAGESTDVDLLTVGPEAIVRVVDQSSAEQTVDGVIHLA
ncbi:hypothetical protein CHINAEXTREME_17260 [Halobiforma lacisalsi AJ5]|uniref:Uncharacterized protein n=1 Tax=Natronobacterium lacisalsi AJ5 TaxID=358396 RepID=M0LP13_NATLA|nr:hypothetical protein [Halobiforma lacisalsi]APW99411.1 hypothetical protein CHINAEXTREME_17260 [Halobiforma lacisalsi AJ5]EMA35287.1 hypothetical protein C445_05523 [Halobiforma lacisalsi AJ5]